MFAVIPSYMKMYSFVLNQLNSVMSICIYIFHAVRIQNPPGISEWVSWRRWFTLSSSWYNACQRLFYRAYINHRMLCLLSLSALRTISKTCHHSCHFPDPQIAPPPLLFPLFFFLFLLLLFFLLLLLLLLLGLLLIIIIIIITSSSSSSNEHDH